MIKPGQTWTALCGRCSAKIPRYGRPNGHCHVCPKCQFAIRSKRQGAAYQVRKAAAQQARLTPRPCGDTVRGAACQNPIVGRKRRCLECQMAAKSQYQQEYQGAKAECTTVGRGPTITAKAPPSREKKTAYTAHDLMRLDPMKLALVLDRARRGEVTIAGVK